MFRILAVALALIGIGALVTGGIGAAGAWMVGGVFFVGKLLFFLLLFGLIAGFFFRGSNGGGPWARRAWRQSEARSQRAGRSGRQDQFDDWHRKAHAREEVDSWVPDDLDE
jgi:hypothetical protein